MTGFNSGFKFRWLNFFAISFFEVPLFEVCFSKLVFIYLYIIYLFTFFLVKASSQTTPCVLPYANGYNQWTSNSDDAESADMVQIDGGIMEGVLYFVPYYVLYQSFHKTLLIFKLMYSMYSYIHLQFEPILLHECFIIICYQQLVLA